MPVLLHDLLVPARLFIERLLYAKLCGGPGEAEQHLCAQAGEASAGGACRWCAHGHGRRGGGRRQPRHSLARAATQDPPRLLKSC